MEQSRWDMSNKVRKCESPLINNLWMHKTPNKQHEAGTKQTTCQSNTQRLPFSILQSHITPPSKLRKFIKNPFEPDLTNRLHQSVISPTVFTKAPNQLQGSPGFTWNIEELAQLQPAKIEESPIQQFDVLDQELETKAQVAIDRFFKQNQIIPSPWNVKQQKNIPCISSDTPSRPICDLNSTKELSKLKKDVWCQTVLSLPLNLPQNVEEALKPFYVFTQEQNTENDDANLSNNSLRRKLFFNHDECANNESIASLSPVKMSESMLLSCSPPQSGMFVHGRLKMLQSRRHSDELSTAKSEHLSSPNISPIYNAENNMLHEKVGHSSHSATQLDFMMDISMDNIPLEKKQISINDCEKLSDHENDKRIEEDHILIGHKTNLDESVNMVELPRYLNTVDNTVYSSDVIFSDKDHNNGASLKMMTEMQNFTRGSYKRSNVMSGAFTQQSISNTVQDTGYQTYSMNNTMHMADSYSDTSVSHKTHCNERIVTSKDNVQLSWKENMSNVFSSTPSKCNKENGS
ncbi:protein aurora borealis [Linepithema humile]|uniref:protein aurora borealis n=1 Tax=Linepithema humile TaxID=83485 RepID=UPI00351DE851